MTYKPGKNVPEELTYREEFCAKLSSNFNVETFELTEDSYPPIFAIEASEQGSDPNVETFELTEDSYPPIFAIAIEASEQGSDPNDDIETIFRELKLQEIRKERSEHENKVSKIQEMYHRKNINSNHAYWPAWQTCIRGSIPLDICEDIYNSLEGYFYFFTEKATRYVSRVVK